MGTPTAKESLLKCFFCCCHDTVRSSGYTYLQLNFRVSGGFNRLPPGSDREVTSPYNINTLSGKKIKRIHELRA